MGAGDRERPLELRARAPATRIWCRLGARTPRLAARTTSAPKGSAG